MIGVVASIVAGAIAGTYVGFLSVIPWIVSLKSRDAGLVAFLLYAIYLGNHISVPTLYSYGSLRTVIITSLSLVLLLDDVLSRRFFPPKHELISIPFLLLGVLFPESFIVGGVLVLISRFRAGKLVVGLLAGTVLTFVVLRGYLDYAGAAPAQAAVASAVGVFLVLVLLFWKTFKKSDLFRVTEE